MTPLNNYIQAHALRLPRESDIPEAVDVVHFKVVAKPSADAETLRELIDQHDGEFGFVDIFDGGEHSYIELGGWLGDQGAALTLMGMGTHLGLWQLLSPKTVLGNLVDAETEARLAGQGLICIQVPRANVTSARTID